MSYYEQGAVSPLFMYNDLTDKAGFCPPFILEGGSYNLGFIKSEDLTRVTGMRYALMGVFF